MIFSNFTATTYTNDNLRQIAVQVNKLLFLTMTITSCP